MMLGSRKILKKEQMNNENEAQRNEQFHRIAALVREFSELGAAVLSIDMKKKEQLGRLHRPGQVLCNEEVTCFDHDFPSSSSGTVITFGLYDKSRNEGYLTLGQSADTAEFNVSCFRDYWLNYGSEIYPENQPILLLMDGGGSNGSSNRLFKQELQDLADEIGRKIRVAHYPPYCSKYNPIEHRLFPFITRAWNGVLLDSISTMKDLVSRRCSDLKSGIKIFVDVTKESFKAGVRVFDNFLDTCDIVHDKINPKWNYLITPV
jgi:Rhodopirellula transposase DDE domain